MWVRFRKPGKDTKKKMLKNANTNNMDLMMFIFYVSDLYVLTSFLFPSSFLLSYPTDF